jgi:multiple sugar transport system substrate-binding protein
MKSKRLMAVLSLVLIVAVLLLPSCAAPQPQVVEKVVEKVVTQVVEKPVEVEKIVTQVVEKRVEVEKTVEVIATAVPGAINSADKAVEVAKEKCAGKEINVVWESGLQPQDPLTFAPQWDKLTGMKTNVVEMAYVDLYTKQMQDAVAGGGAYDVITIAPAWLIDFVNANVVEPLNPYIDQYMNKADLEDYLPVYGAEGYGRLGDTWYGFPDDGDVFVQYYRKDIYEDEKLKADFKAKYGYDLAPAKTYQQFIDNCAFITEKLGPDVYGCAYQHAEGQAFDWFMGPFSGSGGQWFDPDTMKATVNSDIGVKVLADMVTATKSMPPGVQKWGFMEILSAWMDGKVATIITWPPIGRWSEGVGLMTEQLSWVPPSKVVGKVGYAPEPGGRSILAGNFALGVSPTSENKECAYLFIQWMNSPQVSLQRVMLPYALRDPFRNSHYSSPGYRAAWPAAGQYLDTLDAAGMAGQYELGIPGAREYAEAVDQAVTAAYAGTDPKAALDEAAKKFDEITERKGVEAQKEAYANWLKGEWNQPGPK